MFSLEYFKYLLKSKKYILALIILVTLLISVTSINYDFMIFHVIICGMLCFLLPASVFYYIQNKKAVDTFYSLPVSRKKLLFTGLLFCIVTIYMSFMIAFVFHILHNGTKLITLFTVPLFALLAITTLVLFNVAIFSLTNNIVDGVVILGAYTYMPLFILATLGVFVQNYVCGSNGFAFDFLGYLSPSYIGASLLRKVFPVENDLSLVQYLKYIVACIVYIALSIKILDKHYIKRDVERAGSITDNLYTYPFIIFIYVILCMLMIISSYNFNDYGIFQFFTRNIASYVLLFAIFMIAYFLYKRKLSFNYKLPVLYIVLMICSLIFAETAKMTKGFGLTNNYLKYDDRAKYTINSDQGYYYDSDYDPDLLRLAQNTIGRNPTYIGVSIIASGKTTPISKNTLDFIENIRDKSIDEFYSVKDNTYGIAMDITNDNSNRYYHCSGRLGLKDLMTIVNDKTVQVNIYFDEFTFRLDKDGKLNSVADIYKPY